MKGRRSDGTIIVDAPARERLYDSGGVGTPRQDGGIAITWVEAVYLLERGDLDAVDGQELTDFIADPPDAQALDRWLVYRDLRARGYYVSPAYEAGTTPDQGTSTFEVRPRGAPPTSDEVDFRIAAVAETTSLSLKSLGSLTIAVADDEGEITYISVEPVEPAGETDPLGWEPPQGFSVGRRIAVPNPPAPMIDPAFFGREVDGILLLNPLEARYLTETDRLQAPIEPPSDPGERRRFRVYAALRKRGCVPRSGLKFGADFRVYTDVTDASDPGHSSYLVEVLPADSTATPRSLSRAVRLAGGVRKQHLIALTEADSIAWIGLERKRP